MENFMNGHFKSEWTKIVLCFYLTNVNFSKSNSIILFYNWDSLHTRLKNHYKAQSYKKKKHKKHTGNLLRKNLKLKGVSYF